MGMGIGSTNIEGRELILNFKYKFENNAHIRMKYSQACFKGHLPVFAKVY